MKSITTKYNGPTNTRGSRYTATDNDGNRVTVSIDHELGSEDNHDAAALALCRKMQWSGKMVRGFIGTGNVYVFLNEYDVLTIK